MSSSVNLFQPWNIATEPPMIYIHSPIEIVNEEDQLIIKWIEKIENLRDSQLILKRMIKIPEINMSPNNCLMSSLGARLKSSLRWLDMMQIKSLLAWMNKTMEPKQFEGTFDPFATGAIKAKTSPIYFLFLVLKKALDEKDLHNELGIDPNYKGLKATFRNLQLKGLVNP